MAYTIANPSLGYPKITSTVLTAATTPPLPVAHGTIVTANDPVYGAGEFIYLKGVAQTRVGSWVTYNADDFTTALLAPNAIGPVAVAMSANLAGYSGWYQIQGKAVAHAGDVADDGNVFIDASGRCDDATVNGDRVWGAKWASADDDTPATADVEIHRPFTTDGIAG